VPFSLAISAVLPPEARVQRILASAVDPLRTGVPIVMRFELSASFLSIGQGGAFKAI